MKKLFLAVTVVWQCAVCGFAQQQKKPTLMILPSDNWCTQRYFMTTYDNQGVEVAVPNYPQAFREDTELGAVVSKIGALMTDLGYRLKDAEQETKRLAERSAEDNVTTGKSSGASLAESPLDMLKRRTKADIIIQIGWHVNKETAGKSITFTLEAFDAYTSKRIATATGTGKPSGNIVPVLLENAVKANIKAFDRQLDSFYENTQKKGREIVLTVRRWNDWENDLETDYDGESLLDHIQKWLRKNTVEEQFNLADATENAAQFEQVHIPLFNASGNAVDARTFATGLQKYLRAAPFNITSKVMVRGLGEAIVVLGEQ
jgi:hypothetical protein